VPLSFGTNYLTLLKSQAARLAWRSQAGRAGRSMNSTPGQSPARCLPFYRTLHKIETDERLFLLGIFLNMLNAFLCFT